MADARVPESDLLRWSHALSAIARTGIGFTASTFERERYEEVLAVAGDIASVADRATCTGRDGAATGRPPDQYVTEWLADVRPGVAGYVTPRLSVGAIVGNGRGELLLVRRRDSGAWLYPTGWADVGYSAAEVAVKEVSEETGVECEPVRLAMVLDGLRLGFARSPLYSLVFHCRVVGAPGAPRAHLLECSDAGWFAPGSLPSPLAGTPLWAAHAFDVIEGRSDEVLFDRPRAPLWRSGSE